MIRRKILKRFIISLYCYIFISMEYQTGKIKEKTNNVKKTHVVLLHSANPIGGSQTSMGVPPQLVATSPMGRPPNA